ncbi:MAG: hypothetical protein DRQ88_11330 [Epsilonproteobacteria bacterium]|nr:MAG: hypothetical protein DRQ88_11330 [Campylobacterota bacterium]RLA65821.1 MAG: hypothetical protein DRQ89_00275 [Campylobacterota bacterium]
MADLKTREVKKDEILIHAGEADNDLYRVESGKFLAFHVTGSRIDPIKVCEPGKFLGTLRFFLDIKRVLYFVALEDSTVTIIPGDQMKEQFPPWLANIGKSLSAKILDNIKLITNVGVKRKGELMSPLSIEEQRHFFGLIKKD